MANAAPVPDDATKVAVLPLRDVVLFPHVTMPLLVGRASSLAAVEAALNADRRVLLVAQKDGQVEEPAAGDLFRTGTLATITQVSRQANGTTRVLFEGTDRLKVTRYATVGGVLRATGHVLPLPGGASTAEDPAVRRVTALFEEYVGLHRRIPPEIVTVVNAAPTTERQLWTVAAHMAVRLDARQELLEAEDATQLGEQLARLLSAELELLKLERKIDEDVRGSLFQNQREFYLQEQLKAIHRELGSEDDDVAELEAQLEARQLPATAKARVERELRKLRRMSPLSPEATVTRNYLDWIAALPWSQRTDDVLDVAHARTVLDEDHFGLEEVKDRILDHLAILKMVGRIQGPILCLVGPPGVGKTSLGRSIARALGRKFVRMSLGGVRDEAEIRGHRRTYIGAMPGRFLQAMRRAEVMNPVLLLDEVDKLGADFRGDPAAALLEVLDPEQHHAFNDHYLELDYDLSEVFFITTANSLSQIPEALRDRMEIIRLPGYLDQEKVAIARRHLWPKQLEKHGIASDGVTLTPAALTLILRGYTREAGVRDLERRLARVARKVARRRAEGDATALTTVDAADLHALLGPAPHDADEPAREDRVGLATGLAWTSAGGEVLDVEVAVNAGRGRLQLTGTLGDVMKESAGAAVSWIRSRTATLGVPADFAKTRDIHVHLPAGATPKDGPSAGVALVAAIASALSGRAVRGDVAMTGEITLRGRVLPVGGVKEKAVAAHRARVARMVLPKGNVRDLEELPDEVKQGLAFLPVETMDEALALVMVPASADRVVDASEADASASRGEKGARKAPRGKNEPTPGATVPPPLAH